MGDEDGDGDNKKTMATKQPNDDGNNTNVVVTTATTTNFGLRRRRKQLMDRAQATIEQATDLLKRKLPSCAAHFLAPKRLWLRRVETPNCDVVIVFPSNTEDSVLLWLLARLRDATGLTVHVRHHPSTHCSAFYLAAPRHVLVKAAEEYHLPKQLRDAHSYANDRHDNDNNRDCFTTQERQWLVLRVLESIRACKRADEQVIRGGATITPLDNDDDASLIDGQPLLPKCLSCGVVTQIFPLHDATALDRLQGKWVRDVFAWQPLDEISEYFGVKIAMYFAWLGHYTTALTVPAIVGFVFWLCCNGSNNSDNQSLEDVGYVLFSLFNVVWATAYLQSWKRYSAELAFRWGTLDPHHHYRQRYGGNDDDDLLTEPRPLYRGVLKPSAVTGRLEPWQPPWKRHVYRYCVTVPIVVACLSCVFVVMVVSLQIQDWWDQQLRVRNYCPDWLTYLPKIMLAIVITLMDEAYFKVAVWLNDNENYRVETSYENHLIGKVALFQFVNSFLSLFYIAFYLQDQARLKEQLAALLIARQVIGNLKESALPYLLEHLRLARMSFDLWGALSPTTTDSDVVTMTTGKKPSDDDEEEEEVAKETKNNEDVVADDDDDGEDDQVAKTKKRIMSQAELESSLYKYEGTFADYLEMTIQLGYVILFSSAFPPAALCALLNNLIEIRSDAFKLAYVCQRPFGQRVTNIGTWQHCMEYMSIVAVLVNCALIGLSGQVHRMFPDMTATQTILLIVALEHVMLTIRFVITCIIPDVPDWLVTEMARLEWQRRQTATATSVGGGGDTKPPFAPKDGGGGDNTMTGDERVRSIGRFSVSPSRHPTTTTKCDDHQRQQRVDASDRDLLKNLNLTAGGGAAAAHKVAVTSITPDSIQQIPPFRPRRSREWTQQPRVGGAAAAVDHHHHHLTIGPGGGAGGGGGGGGGGAIIDWMKRLKDDDVHKSTDCILTPSKGGVGGGGGGGGAIIAGGAAHAMKPNILPLEDASSSDSDLLQHSNNSVWPPRPRTPPHLHYAPLATRAASKLTEAAAAASSLSDIARTVSASQEGATAAAVVVVDDSATTAAAAAKAAEELAAKKTRVKQSLMKRARSVAIFSLKLKERRAREAAQEKSSSPLLSTGGVAATPPAPPPPTLPTPQCGGGELSLIPIEKLIQLEDVRRNQQQRMMSSSPSATSTTATMMTATAAPTTLSTTTSSSTMTAAATSSNHSGTL